MSATQESLEEYADRITAAWPKPSPAQTARISALLNTSALITTEQYNVWEIKRCIDAETPGLHGFFVASEAAA